MRITEIPHNQRINNPLRRWLVEEEYTNLLFQKAWRPVQRNGENAIFESKHKAHITYNISYIRDE